MSVWIGDKNAEITFQPVYLSFPECEIPTGGAGNNTFFSWSSKRRILVFLSLNAGYFGETTARRSTLYKPGNSAH